VDCLCESAAHHNDSDAQANAPLYFWQVRLLGLWVEVTCRAVAASGCTSRTLLSEAIEGGRSCSRLCGARSCGVGVSAVVPSSCRLGAGCVIVS
jgi:hypothetical protein